MAKEYQTISLPSEVIADLNRLKIALGFQTGRIHSYGEVVKELISGLEKSNPAVYNIYRNVNAESIQLL